jgi:chromosome segregation ATPase
LRKLHAELFQAELWLIEAESEVHILTERNSEVSNMLNARKSEVQNLKTGVQDQKRIAADLGKNIKKIQQEMTDEEELAIWSEYGQNPETTPETLATEIMLSKHKIELLHVGNPRAIEQYEERQRKIDKLTKSLENFEGDIEKVNDDIQRIRDQWEPELDALVAEISEAFTHNFERIGCAGQVGIHKDDEDFKEWAIQIQVKFRYVSRSASNPPANSIQ